MKVLFVWSGLSGYMGDCWRELAGKEGVELKVSVDARSGLPGSRLSFFLNRNPSLCKRDRIASSGLVSRLFICAITK